MGVKRDFKNDMRFLRLIITEYVKTNKKINTDIREELKTFDTNNQIVKWISCIQRNKQVRLPYIFKD